MMIIPPALCWWDWRSTPVRQLPREENPKVMKYVFDINMVGNPTKDQNPWYPCRYFAEFNTANVYSGDVDGKLYNIRRDTHNGTLQAILKYDIAMPCELSLDHRLVRCALDDTLRDYGRFENRGSIRAAGEVFINPDSSSGPVYKKMGFTDKVEVYTYVPELVQWFWDVAHHVDYSVLWKEFGKTELLKVTKNTRGISVAPADFQMAGARMNQHTNELLSEVGNKFDACPSRVGMVMQGGGLDRYAEWLDVTDWLKISSDNDKFDSRILNILFEVVKVVRYHLWDKKGMSGEEWWQRQNYYYGQKTRSFILCSNGQVFLKLWGNPSGQDSTTYDNTIIHAFVKNYLWRLLTGLMYSPDAFVEKREHYRCGLYGDDNNESVSPKYARFFSFEARAKG
jgi:hypothetical protein